MRISVVVPALLAAAFPAWTVAAAETEEALLKRRQTMLRTHQVLGAVTVASGLATVATAHLHLARHDEDFGTVHVALGGATTALYATTASLSLLAPARIEPLPGDAQALDAVQVHKALAWGHGAGMLASLGLGGLLWKADAEGRDRPALTTSYRIAIATTLALLVAAELVMILA